MQDASNKRITRQIKERGQDVKTATGIYPNLNAEIARHNLTSEQIAQNAGISKTSLWRKLSGATDFKLCEIVAIKNAFNDEGLTLDYLFKRG